MGHSAEISGISDTQILREINFGESWSTKTALFAIWGALYTVFQIKTVCKILREINFEESWSFSTKIAFFLEF